MTRKTVRSRRWLALLIIAATVPALLSLAPGRAQEPAGSIGGASATLRSAGENHLANVRQLTFGGQNAEAYFSADDRYLIFQHQGQFYDPQTGAPVGPDVECDQIYTIPVETPGGRPSVPVRVSNGLGRTTCSYFVPVGDRVLYSSTFEGDAACPPPPDYSLGYVWPIYDTYAIYSANRDGSGIRALSTAPGYNAEATVSRDGRHIAFTSTRDGDLEIYSMDADGGNVKRLTHEVGYDGGPFWSYDGTKIVYRAERPKTPAEAQEYKDLLARGLIRPGNLEIWVMNADGSGKRQVTSNGASNFAPYWLPDNRRIIFSSNMDSASDPSGFDLYVINEDGTGLERITYYSGFDGFPMFTSDGRRLVWASNRNGRQPRETNVFIADWIE